MCSDRKPNAGDSMRGALPDTGYMVLMDKIYLLCYVLISMVLFQIIAAGNWQLRPEPVPDAVIIRRERRLAALCLAVFAVGVLALCL